MEQWAATPRQGRNASRRQPALRRSDRASSDCRAAIANRPEALSSQLDRSCVRQRTDDIGPGGHSTCWLPFSSKRRLGRAGAACQQARRLHSWQEQACHCRSRVPSPRQAACRPTLGILARHLRARPSAVQRTACRTSPTPRRRSTLEPKWWLPPFPSTPRSRATTVMPLAVPPQDKPLNRCIHQATLF